MCDEKPFAEVDEGDRDEMEMPELLIDGIVTVCAHDDTEHDDALKDFRKDAARINAAVAARERKAAARALRDAARDFVGARSADDEWTAEDVRAWLRARAAAIEGGAT